MRLIDADVLPNYKCKTTATVGDHKGLLDWRFVFWQDVEKAPTIDAAPVVRCRECWKRGNDLYCPMCHKEYFYDEDDGGDWELFDDTEDDGFCHRGKKKDGKEG